MKLGGARPLAGFAFIALLLLAAAQGLQPSERASPLIGNPLPAFELPRLGEPGSRFSPAQMRGRVWVLNTWASWCAVCRDEHPLLVGLARESGVWLVGLNYKDDPRDAQEWLHRLGNPYAAIAADREGRTDAGYGVRGVPETFIIDPAGVVRHRHTGPLTRAVWTSELMPLIERMQGSTTAP